MPGTEDLAAPVNAPVEETARTPSAVRKAVLGVLLAGLACSTVVLFWVAYPSQTQHLADNESLWPLLILLAAAFLSEIVYVPIPGADEELTFYEVVVMMAVLIFSPSIAVTVPLVGFMCALPFLRIPSVKAVFDLGAYALAGSALVAAYTLIARDGPVFGLASVIGLIVGSLAFAAVNLVLLALILKVAEATPPLTFIREQWSLSGVMAIGNVAVAATAVALAANTPLLTPFALMPAAALWYAYQSSAQHTAAVERNRWLVVLNALLAEPSPPSTLVPGAGDALRRVFAADFVRVLTPDAQYSGNPLVAHPQRPTDQTIIDAAGAQPARLPAHSLPPKWASGYTVRLDLAEGPGALVLGGRPVRRANRFLPWASGVWHMSDVDLPVLASIAASFSGAVRAGQHFAALREETAKLTAVVDNATDGIAVFEGSGSVVLWSPAMEFITGIPEHIAEQGTDAPGSGVIGQLRTLAEASTDPREESLSVVRPDGEERELSVAVVALGDETDMRVMTVRDVTQQRRVERMKSDFIATVSHELRTPITPIKGYAQLLSGRWERMPESKRTDVLAMIVDRADHLSRLVDDLLLASRVSDVQTAKLDVDLTDMDLADLVTETVSAFPGLTARISVSGDTATVRCDRVRAIQCLSNLITNAAKYSPADSPICVEFGPAEGGRWATVDVIDHGRGIPAQEQERVFERFYRVEDPMTMTTGGSGLGLFISRELARAMDGDIRLTSTPGQGSTFQLRLPVSAGGAS